MYRELRKCTEDRQSDAAYRGETEEVQKMRSLEAAGRGNERCLEESNNSSSPGDKQSTLFSSLTDLNRIVICTKFGS